MKKLFWASIAHFCNHIGNYLTPTLLIYLQGSISMGILFTGATSTGAIAPTIFGFLVDELGVEASFLFLGSVAFTCLVLIFLVKFVYQSIIDQNDSKIFVAE